MAFLDKVRSKSLTGRGHVKQRFGRATGNRRIQADGLADRATGAARQLAGQLKDAAGRVGGWLKDAARDLRRGARH